MTPLEAYNCEQGSEQWKQARAGMPTASCLGAVIATLAKKKGEAKERSNYRMQIVCEILTGQPTPEGYISPEMRWGKEQERFARAAYEIDRDVMVETCGFVVHPRLRFGCSPDGLIGDDGLLELKCPNTSTHLRWMMEGIVPLEHAPQVVGGLACFPNRQWVDFLSFDPRLIDPKLHKFIVRFPRQGNEHLIAAVEAEVERFNAEIDEVLARFPKSEPQPITSILNHYDPEEHLLQ